MRIKKYTTNKPFDIKDVDFENLGFKRNIEWDKGREATTVYTDEAGEKIVKKTFTDILNNENTLIGYETKTEYFDYEDNVADFKIVKNYLDELEANEFLTKRRKRAMTIIIHYLLDQTESQEETAELFCLFDFYKSEIDTFINFGGERLKTKLENESNEEINEILETEVGGQKVRDIIINTIT